MKFTWQHMKDFLLFAIGIGIVFFMNDLQNDVEEAKEASTVSIAGHCRVLSVMDQPLSPDGPCYEPEVLVIWKDLPTKPLEVVLDESAK